VRGRGGWRGARRILRAGCGGKLKKQEGQEEISQGSQSGSHIVKVVSFGLIG
jgi:hypothetical protein